LVEHQDRAKRGTDEVDWDGTAGSALSHDDPLGYLRAWVQLNHSVALRDQGQQAEADRAAAEVLDRALAAFGSLVTPQQADRARTTRLLYEVRSANGMSTWGLEPARMDAGPRLLSYRAVY